MKLYHYINSQYYKIQSNLIVVLSNWDKLTHKTWLNDINILI